MYREEREGGQGYYFSKIINVQGHISKEHYHDSFEIYYMKDGSCDYFIGSSSFPVTKGDVVLIPAGTIHRTIYGALPHSRYLVNFTGDYITEELRQRFFEADLIYRNADITDELEAIFAKLEAEYSTDDSFTPGMLSAYTCELLCLIFRNKNEICEQRERENRLVSLAVEYLLENYMNDVTLASVARELSVSFEHLSRIFKRETGFGFNEYLTLLRLQRAEYMLKNEPGLKISEVAYSVGFNDSNYFSYKFKQQFGCPPTGLKRK